MRLLLADTKDKYPDAILDISSAAETLYKSMGGKENKGNWTNRAACVRACVPACASTCDCVRLRVPACACVCLGVCASVQQCVCACTCALACVTFVTRRISLKLRECTPPPALAVCTQFKSSHCLYMLFLIKCSRCLVHCVLIHILTLSSFSPPPPTHTLYLFLSDTYTCRIHVPHVR